MATDLETPTVPVMPTVDDHSDSGCVYNKNICVGSVMMPVPLVITIIDVTTVAVSPVVGLLAVATARAVISVQTFVL